MPYIYEYTHRFSRFSTARIFHTKVCSASTSPWFIAAINTIPHIKNDTPLPDSRLSAPSLGVAPRIVDVAAKRHDRGQSFTRLMVQKSPTTNGWMYKTLKIMGHLPVYHINWRYTSDNLPVSDGSSSPTLVRRRCFWWWGEGRQVRDESMGWEMAGKYL